MNNKFIKNLGWLLLIFIPIFLLFKNIFPTIPSLSGRFTICKDQHLGWITKESTPKKITIRCQVFISSNILYKAKRLVTHIQTMQQFKMKIALVNGDNEVIASDPLASSSQIRDPIKLWTFELDNPLKPKFNRLGNDVNGVSLTITDFEKDKKEDLQILDLYLE